MLEEAPKVETRDRMVVLRDALKTKLKPGQGFQRFPVKIGFTCFKEASGVWENLSGTLGHPGLERSRSFPSDVFKGLKRCTFFFSNLKMKAEILKDV